MIADVKSLSGLVKIGYSFDYSDMIEVVVKSEGCLQFGIDRADADILCICGHAMQLHIVYGYRGNSVCTGGNLCGCSRFCYTRTKEAYDRY